MLKATLTVSVLATLVSVNCHVFRVGKCPEVEVMKEFDMKKFLGEWFVVQRFRTTSECVVENITLDDDGHYYITETMQPLGLSRMLQRGKISFPKNEPESVMQVDYPMSRPLGEQNYWVLMTDYDNYALVWTCQRLLFGHRQSASILSRSPTLNKEYSRKIRRRLQDFGINEHYLSFVEQQSCRKDANERQDCLKCKNASFSFKVGPFEFSAKN